MGFNFAVQACRVLGSSSAVFEASRLLKLPQALNLRRSADRPVHIRLDFHLYLLPKPLFYASRRKQDASSLSSKTSQSTCRAQMLQKVRHLHAAFRGQGQVQLRAGQLMIFRRAISLHPIVFACKFGVGYVACKRQGRSEGSSGGVN